MLIGLHCCVCLVVGEQVSLFFRPFVLSFFLSFRAFVMSSSLCISFPILFYPPTLCRPFNHHDIILRRAFQGETSGVTSRQMTPSHKHPFAPPLDELIQHKRDICKHEAADVEAEELGGVA